MKNEALVVQISGWILMAISVFELISRSPWVSSDGMPLPSSDGVPYGIFGGMGLITAGKALARIEATLEKREGPRSS